MGVEVKDTGIDWVDRQIKDELNALQESKFDKNISIKYLKNLNKNSYKEVMAKNSGATIVAIQVLLKELGYNIGKIDGILKTKGSATSRTMNAIKDFQGKNGLQPDGAPGPLTINKLLEKFGSGGTTPPASKPTPNPRQSQNPEQQQQLPEMTLADLKKVNRNSLGSFQGNKFVFKRGVEKSDSKGKYIVVNGKKLYELGNNKKKGLYYSVGITVGGGGGLRYGEHINGDLNGRGGGNYSSGNKYVGQWKNGKHEGQGTFTRSSGEKYIGQLKNGNSEGLGIEYYSNGNKHKTGRWKDDKLWTGYVYDKDGKTVLERRMNGKQVN